MVLKRRSIFVAMKDVPTMLRKEEYVLDMVLKRRLAVIKDVPIRYRLEDYATNTERRGRLAVTRDAPNMLLGEGFAGVMVLRIR